MAEPITCFFLTPTDRYRVSLRRFVFSTAPHGACSASGHGYHDASVVVGEETHAQAPACPSRCHCDDPACEGKRMPVALEDPRWPTHCACGYAFAAADEWQVNYDCVHTRSDGCPACTLRDAPAGAMWDAFWMPAPRRGPDGLSLVVRTPGGDWMVDGPSHHADGSVQASPGWTRTGTVPHVTASPSILMHRDGYHGWLRDGRLVPC